MTSDEERAVVDRHVAELMEHFDTVQVFVTRHDGGKEATLSFRVGDGNYFARYGAVKEWLTREEAAFAETDTNCDDEDERD